MADAALYFETSAFVLDGPRLMGIHSASNSLLRAMVAARGDTPLWVLAPDKPMADACLDLARRHNPQAQAVWVPNDQPEALAEIGCLHVNDPQLGLMARRRLRAGPAAYSMTGITHSLSGNDTMDALTDLAGAPIMPWDALICTSTAAADVVRRVLEAQRAYNQWRFGTRGDQVAFELPVIPLGIHTGDFAVDPGSREEARARFGIAPDEVVALFVGRLAFHAKAHPHQMYQALEAAARRTGRRLVLLQCGWFGSEAVEAVYRSGAEDTCPSVRTLFADGRDREIVRRSYGAADLFISLSDNIQESFGLTPVEAMAAGLPVLVSDWDGYRDTVRQGVDGFRVTTRMPANGAGEDLARAHEVGKTDNDLHFGLTCMTISVDLAELTDRLCDLVTQPDLRRRLGEAGLARARQDFDWSRIMARYQTLWAELGRIRRACQAAPDWRRWLDAAPRHAPGREDPYDAFAGFATQALTAETRVAGAGRGSVADYRVLCDHGLFNFTAPILPPPDRVAALLAGLQGGPRLIAALAEDLGVGAPLVIRDLSILIKLGLVHVQA